MNLFQRGDFTLVGGASSFFKIECDALTDDDVHCLATMIAEMVGPFCHCVGVPRGGLRFQNMLSPLATHGPVLFVDDVLTTGGSITNLLRVWREQGDERVKPGEFTWTTEAVGAVVFARGKCPSWIRPLFRLDDNLYLPGD